MSDYQTLDPAALASFDARRRSLMTEWGQQSAANDYARSVAIQRGSRQVADLTQQYNKQRTTLPYRYANQGIMDSGMYQSALQEYARQRLQATSDQQIGMAQQLGQFDVTGAGLAAKYQDALAEVEQQKQAQIAAIAAALKAAQPYTV